MTATIRNILIIDDEAVFREAIHSALATCGYASIMVDSPAEGLIKLKSKQFDLILLDIMMDPLDGWDTLEHFKVLPGDLKTPILLASAKKLLVDEVMRYGEQVWGFIPKPFMEAEFCETIAEFFSWYNQIVAFARSSQDNGVPCEISDQWMTLTRQIRAMEQMKQVISSWAIPDETSPGGENLAGNISQIDEFIGEKRARREELIAAYPYLQTGPVSG